MANPGSARRQHTILLSIVTAQFCGTSLWFAANAVLPDLQQLYHWPDNAVGYVTSATQLGFIAGTLAFAMTGLSDRFSPGNVFFVCSFGGAVFNGLATVDLSSWQLALASRLLTGITLAGIYPVGMKIASDWRAEGLGNWLGALVGALVLGTALPHGLTAMPGTANPQRFLLGVSVLSIAGGTLMRFTVPDGPYRRRAAAFSFAGVSKAFRLPAFRGAALGYFGHMWELYAWWAFVPWAIHHFGAGAGVRLPTSPLAFLIIGIGALGCVVGGRASLKFGSARVATSALVVSGVCCVFSPLMWSMGSIPFVLFMCAWGFFVVADSPQFSSLVARHAPAELRGSAITLVTSIGFAITIASIQLLNYAQEKMALTLVFLLLLPGPLFGLFSMVASSRKTDP